jgi:hypothetical protein
MGDDVVEANEGEDGVVEAEVLAIDELHVAEAADTRSLVRQGVARGHIAEER